MRHPAATTAAPTGTDLLPPISKTDRAVSGPTPRTKRASPHEGHLSVLARRCDSTRTGSLLTVVMAAHLSQQEALPVSAKTGRGASHVQGHPDPAPHTQRGNLSAARHPHLRWRSTAPRSSTHVAPDTARAIASHRPHGSGMVWWEVLPPCSPDVTIQLRRHALNGRPGEVDFGLDAQLITDLPRWTRPSPPARPGDFTSEKLRLSAAAND